MLTPRTRRMFPMIEPVIDAFTTPTRPLDRATRAMSSSVAFPNVAFRRPPRPGPACLLTSSVATPIAYARGTIATPAIANPASGFAVTAHTATLRGTRKKNARTRRERTGRFASATGGPEAVPRYQPAVPQNVEREPSDADRVLTAAEQRVMDRNAEYFGVSILDLMEAAGRGGPAASPSQVPTHAKRELVAWRGC